MRILQYFSNAAGKTTTPDSLACFSNEFSLAMAEDGRPAEWLQIPYGDHHHALGVIQRLNRPSAEVLVSNFKSIASSLGRLFGGSPIYIGHPDDPAFSNQFSDRKSYGWVLDMEARADGLYIKPKWGAAGLELLSNAHFKWFSPRWGCKPLPGVRANGLPVVEPVKWVSLGLTNDPNIQGIPPLANETQQTEGATAMREQLIALLGLAPDATDEQIIAAATQLKEASAAGATAVANEKTARATAETALANERTERAAKEASLQSTIQSERKERINLILANAIAAGKITEAQKPQWAADLAASFDAKVVELSNAAPALPQGGSQTGDLGNRNADAQAKRDVQTRRDKILLLVNERMDKAGEDYTTAYSAIKHANPSLFADMQTPGKK